jgi:hypothetical protein
MACSMSPSSTSSNSSTCWRISGRHSAPGLLTAMPSAMVLAPCGVRAAGDGVHRAGKARRLHADHADAGLERLGRRGHAADQAAAANGTTSVSRSGCSASISSASVPWPAMMASSSNGCTKVSPCSRASACVRAGGVERVAVQDHFGAEAARARHLHAGGEARHDDDGADAQALRMKRHALRVVAGAHGHHAARALLGVAQLHQLVAARRAP